jgi:AcrR family transcriptional regulator
MKAKKKASAVESRAVSVQASSAERGRKSVEAKLIKATCALLAKRGPKAVTIRDIATRAGVNHGQIHHYFGGKKGLIVAAVQYLAQDHAQRTAERIAEREHERFEAPPALSLAEDQTYVMSIIRLALDGELELATLDLENGNSVPRNLLNSVSKSLGQRKPSTELKSALATAMAIEWGWAALGPYILRVIDARPNEEQKIRKRVGEFSRELVNQFASGK